MGYVGIGNCSTSFVYHTCTKGVSGCHNGGSCYCNRVTKVAKCSCFNGYRGENCEIPPGIHSSFHFEIISRYNTVFIADYLISTFIEFGVLFLCHNRQNYNGRWAPWRSRPLPWPSRTQYHTWRSRSYWSWLVWSWSYHWLWRPWPWTWPYHNETHIARW